MSTCELTRLDVMQRLRDHRLTQCEAAKALSLSTRQIKRLWKAYQREGERSLISRRRSRPSNHRLDAALVARAEELIRTRYHDFGPTLAHERVD
jgi:transposase